MLPIFLGKNFIEVVNYETGLPIIINKRQILGIRSVIGKIEDLYEIWVQDAHILVSKEKYNLVLDKDYGREFID